MFLASALAFALVVAGQAPLDGARLGFEEITGAVGQNGHARSRELMEAWVRAHPADPNAGRGIIWIAQLYVADGEGDASFPYYQRAARDYPGTDWGNHGIRGMAELDLLHRHYGRALAGYQALAANPAPLWNYIGRMGVEQTRSERLRFIWFAAAAVGLLALLGARLWLARKAGQPLWRLPEECVYLLPVFVLMILAAFRQPSDEGRAVVSVALGGMVLLWANGLYLRARPPRKLWRLGEAALSLVQAGALLYCAVIANNIWLKFHDTLVMGAE